MGSRKHCYDCHSKDFLGIECAWPATECLIAPPSRRQTRGMWTRRLFAFATAVALVVGAWHWMA